MTNQASMDLLQSRLNELRTAYLSDLPAKVQDIEQTWQTLKEGIWQPNILERLHRLVHNLAGSGMTYGLETVSRQARLALDVLRPWMKNHHLPTAEERGHVDQLLNALKRTAIARGGTVAPPVAHAFKVVEPPEMTLIAPVEAKDTTDGDVGQIFLVEDDPEQAAFLATCITHHGYRIRTFSDLNDLREAVQTTTPAAIISDMVFPEGHLAGANAIADLQKSRDVPYPVIFMSSRNDTEARISAVRANGLHYLTKPVDVGKLIKVLDDVTTLDVDDPYRILLVDDDVSVNMYYALLLGMARMNVLSISKPERVLDAIHYFRPDLVLMDLHMPEYTGAEIAAIIRQHTLYGDLPILFLSQETDVDAQLEAVSVGGDAFLPKASKPEQLIEAIRARIRRERTANSASEAQVWRPNVQRSPWTA